MTSKPGQQTIAIHILPIQVFFLHNKILKTKILISCEREELFRWNKKHVLSFLKGLLVIKNGLRFESAPLNLLNNVTKN